MKCAREYLRVSGDKSGRMESPAEQHDVNAEHATRNGWQLGDPYAEPEAVSASRWSVKVRGAFADLLGDLEGGRFGADILILWESSRGSRRVGEWVRLIDACEGAAVSIYVTSHGRLYDPADDRDRRTLLEDAVDSEWESAKISKRVRRTTAARAGRGEPHGRIPFGYRRIYDPVTRRLAAQEKHPEEGAVVIELFARLYAGDSFKAVARDFESRGIMTRGSKKWPPRPFQPVVLRTMALSPTYIGLRTWQPTGKRGAAGPRKRGSLEGTVKGTWPAIVDEEVFHVVHARVSDPSRLKSRPGGAKHLLTFIGECEPCGSPLTVKHQGGARFYVCRDGTHVKVNADDLDRKVSEIIVAYLSRPAVDAQVASSPDSAAELKRVRKELAKARGDLLDWQAKAGRLEVSATSFAVIEPPILAEIGRLEGRERRLLTPAELDGWTGPGAQGKWDSAPLPAKRRIARLLLTPPYLGPLAVMRLGRGRTARIEDRMMLSPDRD